MGRKGTTRLSRLLITALIVLFVTGCRDRTPVRDFGASFSPAGEESVRELGIYAADKRVGDLRLARVKGYWEGTSPAIQLSEKVLLRLSFRSDQFKVTSKQTSYVGEAL